MQAHAASIWRHTAAQPAPAFPALAEDAEFDVAIIGGGFTGLSAAHHLLSAGLRCAVLEANDVGWGASGRTAGMAGTRYKKGFAVMASHYGADEARRLHAMIHEAIDTLEAIVRTYGIPDAFSRCGQLIPAHAGRALDALEADARWLSREVGDAAPRMLDREATARETGSGAYVGAWYDPRGGAVHPLNYVRGLASALAGRGVPIYASTPVTAVREEADGVILDTPGGRVRARQAILATNAYTDMALRLGDLHRRIVPVSASLIATAPLTANVAATILPSGHVASDTRRLLHGFRMLPGNRLVFSGRADITGRRADDPGAYGILEKVLSETFPQLGPVQITHRWSGFVAMSRDNFPHIGRLGRHILFAIGYSGRGVTLANLMGKYLARMICGEDVDAGPMSKGSFAPFPLHGLRIPAMQLTAAVYKALDWMERR